MRPLKDSLDRLLKVTVSPETLANVRLQQVWEQLIEDSSYTGAVIYDKKNPDIVVVYTVSSLHKAVLDAEQEIYRLRLNEVLRPSPAPPIKELRFVVSRWTALDKTAEQRPSPLATTRVEPLPLNEDEDRHARDAVAVVRDARLKDRLYRAMKASLEWKKGREATKTSQRPS